MSGLPPGEEWRQRIRASVYEDIRLIKEAFILVEPGDVLPAKPKVFDDDDAKVNLTGAFRGPGLELWVPHPPHLLPEEPTPATMSEGSSWFDADEPHPIENYRKFHLPKSKKKMEDLFNPSNKEYQASSARMNYWHKVLPSNTAYFPLGIHHYTFEQVMFRFIPSGRYHTAMYFRLREIRKWVGDHQNWRQAKRVHNRTLRIGTYVPPRMLYVLFALGTPIKGGDIYHFSFSEEIASMIKDTHLHFLIPNLRGQFGDTHEDWEKSTRFWGGHAEYEEALEERLTF